MSKSKSLLVILSQLIVITIIRIVLFTWLWNWVIVDVFSFPAITHGQAWLILITATLAVKRGQWSFSK